MIRTNRLWEQGNSPDIGWHPRDKVISQACYRMMTGGNHVERCVFAVGHQEFVFWPSAASAIMALSSRRAAQPGEGVQDRETEAEDMGGVWGAGEVRGWASRTPRTHRRIGLDQAGGYPVRNVLPERLGLPLRTGTDRQNRVPGATVWRWAGKRHAACQARQECPRRVPAVQAAN